MGGGEIGDKQRSKDVKMIERIAGIKQEENVFTITVTTWRKLL